MSFLRGGKASLEKLLAAKEELLVAEQKLMTLRSTILDQKEDQEHRKQHLQSLETEQQDHLDRAEEQASLINTYNVQIEELKDQIQTLLGLIQEAKRVNSTINLNRFEFPEKLQTKLTHNSNLRRTLMQSG